MRFALLPAVLAMAGCAGTVVPVREVTTDQAGYLAKNFSAENLLPAVASRLPADPAPPVSFSRIEVKFSADEDMNGKKTAFRIKSTYTPLGKGVIRLTKEFSNNDIAYAHLYALSYRGLTDLRWQRVPLHGSLTTPMYEVKEIKSFGSVSAIENQAFRTDVMFAGVVQIMNFNPHQASCKAGQTREAKSLAPGLLGQAVELSCEYSANSVLSMKSQYVYLKDYGVALLLEVTESGRKAVYTIDSVAVVP